MNVGAETLLTMLVKSVLIMLATGPANQDPAPMRISERLYHGQAPLYAELRVGALRRQVRKRPDLRRHLFGDQPPAALRKQAVDDLARTLNLPAAALHRHIDGLRAIGVWYLALGRDEECQRLLVAADFGKTSAIGKMLTGLKHERIRVHQQTYGNREITGVMFGRRFGTGVWLTEKDGLVLLALDPLVIKRVIAAPPTKAQAAAGDAFLRVRIDGRAAMNNIMALVDDHDRREFLGVADLFDVAAYETLELDVGLKRAEARLALAPNSDAAGLLKPPTTQTPWVAAPPTEGMLAVAVGSDRGQDIWKRIKTSLAPFNRHGNSPTNEVETLFRQKFDLNLEKHVLARLQAAALVIPPLKRMRHIDDEVAVLARFDKAETAKTAFDKFLAAIRQEVNDIAVDAADNGTYAQIGRDGSEGAIAVRGNTVMICPAERLGPKWPRQLWRTATAAAQADEQDAHMVAGVYFDPTPLIGKCKPLTGRVRRQKNELVLTLDYTLAGDDGLLARLRPFQGGPQELTPLTKARARARRVNNMANLKQVGTALIMYSGDWNGNFPKNLQVLKDNHYLAESAVYYWVHPAKGRTQKQYLYFPGFKDDAPNPTTTMLAADPESYDGKRCALFVDGHVELITEPRFQELARKQGGVKLTGKPKAEIPKAKQKTIRALCRQLGHDDFNKRRAAYKALKAMGADALEVIREFEKDDDPEIRMAVKRLLGGD